VTEIRVLVVDDHPMVRAALTEVLAEQDGVTVVGQCEDGSQVVEATQRLKPDVVCMDMAMPVMTGLDATEALRAAGADVRVVMLSAEASPPVVAAAGADALVPKTARPDALLSCLRSLVTRAGNCPYCL
jgi:DNA-binding NarL/FixJ family response regulator